MLKKIINPYYHKPKTDSVELLSIHIPRTATNVFKQVLGKIYDKKRVLTFYDEALIQPVREGLPIDTGQSRVLHGHFPATIQLKQQFPDAKVITWMRDPIQRAISHYYYWKELSPHGNEAHDLFMSRHYEIDEFVEEFSIHLQAMSLFQDFDINQFDFIGTVENYSKDIQTLQQIMGWKSYPEYKINVNTHKDISFKTEVKLRELLKEEIAIYNMALSKRH